VNGDPVESGRPDRLTRLGVDCEQLSPVVLGDDRQFVGDDGVCLDVLERLAPDRLTVLKIDAGESMRRVVMR
jgi:hypothetical protein